MEENVSQEAGFLFAQSVMYGESTLDLLDATQRRAILMITKQELADRISPL